MNNQQFTTGGPIALGLFSFHMRRHFWGQKLWRLASVTHPPSRLETFSLQQWRHRTATLR